MTKHHGAQLEEVVISQFEDQISLYTDKASLKSSPIPDFLPKWIDKQNDKSAIALCEFGGGNGLLLNSIAKLCKAKVNLTNVEIVKDYKNYQVNKSIKFMQGSILCSEIPDRKFDVVMVRNVLHHLIGKSMLDTRLNQLDAIREMLRVTKPGGIVVIDEQVNNSWLATRLMYYASRMASKLKIRIDKLQITPNTIVGYMTRNELVALCKRCVSKKGNWSSNRYQRWKIAWRWRIFGIMEDTGTAFVVLKKE